MKNLISGILMLAFVLAVSCSGGRSDQGGKPKHERDTGYTGTRSYIKNDVKFKEVEFKNGVRQGMTRTFYKGGMLEQEIPYVDGRKNGAAKWYYPDGKLFRTTPYVNDTISGSQVQYYKNGNVKAKLDYVDGKRVPGVEEYMMDGKKVDNYPSLKYRVSDQYEARGVYKLFIEMSDLSENVKYYRGDLTDGLVDMNVLVPLMQTATTGYLDLKKTEGHQADSVSVVASYLTGFGNRLYYRLAIPLPYKDLN